MIARALTLAALGAMALVAVAAPAEAGGYDGRGGYGDGYGYVRGYGPPPRHWAPPGHGWHAPRWAPPVVYHRPYWRGHGDGPPRHHYRPYYR